MAFRVEDVLQWTSGRLANESEVKSRLAEIKVSRPADLESSSKDEIAFFFNPRAKEQLAKARPAVLVTGEKFVEALRTSGMPVWKEAAVIAVADPYHSMAVVSGKLSRRNPYEMTPDGVHPTAVVHESAELAPGLRIGPHCVIEPGVKIGTGSVLYPHCTVGVGTKLGARTVLFPNVVIYDDCVLGDDVKIHAASVIGADGFGYAVAMKDGRPTHHEKIHHSGRVVIGNNVEIGAHTTIDRGTVSDTIISDDVIIDNQVQVGHNTVLKKGVVICGNAGLAGGTVVEPFAVLGGSCSIVNKAVIGAGAKIGVEAVIDKDVPPGEEWTGNPGRERMSHFRIQAHFNKLIKKRK